MPAALLELVDELALLPLNPPPQFPDSGGPMAWLVYAAPEEHCPPLVERAQIWLSTPSMYPATAGWICKWLSHVIEQRSPGWREAYMLVVPGSK